MKKCKDCIYEYASSSCAREKKENEFTGVTTRLENRNPNAKGTCVFHIPRNAERPK